MNHRTSATYPHKLSPEAAKLLQEFDKRIRQLSGVEPSSNAKEYIAYKAPGMQKPCVYSDRRKSKFVVRLDIPFEKITRTIAPKGLCEKGNASPTFFEGPQLISHVMVRCDSINRIEDIITLIQQVFSLKPKPSRPKVNRIKRSLSPEQHTRIATNLNEVYEYATKLLDSVRKLQVELREVSHDDDSDLYSDDEIVESINQARDQMKQGKFISKENVLEDV